MNSKTVNTHTHTLRLCTVRVMLFCIIQKFCGVNEGSKGGGTKKRNQAISNSVDPKFELSVSIQRAHFHLFIYFSVFLQKNLSS